MMSQYGFQWQHINVKIPIKVEGKRGVIIDEKQRAFSSLLQHENFNWRLKGIFSNVFAKKGGKGRAQKTSRRMVEGGFKMLCLEIVRIEIVLIKIFLIS